MAIQDIMRLVEADEQRLLERLRELVEIESPSEDKVGVDRAARLVEGWAAKLDGQAKWHPQAEFGDVLELNFGGELPSAKKAKRVLLLGHLDTVWPLGTLPKMQWCQQRGNIYGPGVLDMCAGVVMALEAVAALRELGAMRPVTLLLNSEEEIGSPISRAITEKIAKRCAAVFVLEPAQGLAYKTARKGVGHFDLKVEGVAAHAGVDFARGHSAVLEMARLVEKISAFTDEAKGITVNVGVMQGGTRSNVIAAECRAEVDVRIAKASDAQRMEKKFGALKTTNRACKLTVSGGINRPPMERKPGTVALFKKARALAVEMGFVLEEAATGGGSDGNFTAALGVPTLDGMGAVGAGAHAAHEHVVAKHLVERTALLAAMIAAV
jgi:glutamate carboxypeptidase